MNIDLCSEAAYYIFDEAAVRARVRRIRELLGIPVKLAFAVKANPFLTGSLIGIADRFEICSPGEELICEQAGVPADISVISGVYKTPSEIERTISSDCGRIYTVESLRQFDLLAGLAVKYGKKLPILLRLTNGSQFGLDEEDILSLAASRAVHPLLEYRGIQYFSGTQKTSLKKLRRELEELESFLNRLADECGWTPEELEYGPGFPAAYFGEEGSYDELIRMFGEAAGHAAQKYTLTLELGRCIAACAGQYYTHVVDLKHCKGQNYALTDGGMHQMVYYGQFMGMKQPEMTVCGKETLPPQNVWNICGALCSMNDIIVKQAPLPQLEVGDLICFYNTGAYCVTEGAALFLSRELPAVYIRRADGELICARPATPIHSWNMIQE